MLDTSTRFAFNEEHEMFRDSVRKVFDQALLPNLDRFEEEGICSREFWKACGDAGMLCPNVDGAYGGLGLDFGYNAVVAEELGYAGSSADISARDLLMAEAAEQQMLLASDNHREALTAGREKRAPNFIFS